MYMYIGIVTVYVACPKKAIVVSCDSHVTHAVIHDFVSSRKYQGQQLHAEGHHQSYDSLGGVDSLCYQLQSDLG